MSDELKSAWEIALEKLEQQDETQVESLTDEQRAEIAEIRKKYGARIAETEINIRSQIKKALQSGAYDQIDDLKNRLSGEKKRLGAEMERKIEKIRKGNE